MSDLNKLRDEMFEQVFTERKARCNYTDSAKELQREDWNEAWDALLSVLTEAAGEFVITDPVFLKIEAEAKEKGLSTWMQKQHYGDFITVVSAMLRRQFEQDRARIGLAETRAKEAKEHCVWQYNADLHLRKQLEARLAESEVRLKNQEETIAKYQGNGYKEMRNKLAASEARVRELEEQIHDRAMDRKFDDK